MWRRIQVIPVDTMPSGNYSTPPKECKIEKSSCEEEWHYSGKHDNTCFRQVTKESGDSAW